MAELIIAWGSNLGDRAQYAAQALTLTRQSIGDCLAASPSYATAPIGAADQPFLNGAWLFHTRLTPEACLNTMLAIEASLGRVRRERYGNRTIDLDLLLWRQDNGASLVTKTAHLTIPHPELLARDFALVPAAAVAPDWQHPHSGRSLAEEVTLRGYHLQVVSV